MASLIEFIFPVIYLHPNLKCSHSCRLFNAPIFYADFLFKVGIVLSNWGASKLVPILKNATVDGKKLSSVKSIEDLIAIAPLCQNISQHKSKRNNVKKDEKIDNLILGRVVSKVGQIFFF